MFVWEVLGRRTAKDEFVVVGGVKAPDADMALMLARETHFRHKEGVAYAVRRRGDEELHLGAYDADLLGGLTDRSYRRQEAYAGVGAKLKRIAAETAKRGLVIDGSRPKPGHAQRAAKVAPPGGPPPAGDISPEDLAAQGTAG